MARKINDRLPADPAEMLGITKAAVLMLTLEPAIAGELLKKMPAEVVEEVVPTKVPNAAAQGVRSMR